jgi:Family of unknown function (DUF6151)
MSEDVQLSCRCGEVRGSVHVPSTRSINRVICYCDDCQAFAHHLGRAELLDAHGGSDIVQVAPAALRFREGRIAGLRLTPKGLYRWYASCCKTPLGNTMGPRVPYVGIGPEAFGLDGPGRDEAFGKPRGAILGKFAIGTPPPTSTKQLSFLFGTVRLLLGWKLTGKTWPHPFFDRATRAPKHPVTVLSREEREALRPLCGPRPA